jgi:predicted lipid-binding transport protein (Tim44 family)
LNCGIPELRVPGSQLSELHGMRILADYDMDNDDPEDFETARLWVNEARTHLNAIQQAFTGADRQKVVAAIRGYRKTVGR